MATNRETIKPSVTAISKTQSESSGDTFINVVKTSYTWTIHNFSACDPTVGKYLESPIFFGGLNDSLEWRLRLYPCSETEENKNFVSVYLLSAWEDEKTTARGISRFSILNARREKQNIKGGGTYTLWTEKSKGWGSLKFISRDDLKGPSAVALLPNDTLTIVTEFSVVVDTVNIANDKRHTQNVPKCRILEDLSALYESQKFCDVTLVVGDRKFNAHKAILVARSRVFSAMFDDKMAEARLNAITITDVDGDTLEAMLRFVYSGETKNLDKMAAELLVAANKYDIKRLKRLCEETLSNGLTIENVAGQLIFGDTHSAAHLKTRAIDFIYTHFKDVIATAGYKSMHVTHPNLMDEAVQTLFVMRDKNSGKTATAPPAATTPELTRTSGRKRKTKQF